MKRIISILCTALLLLVPLTACRGAVPPPVPGTSPVSGSGAASQVQQPDTTAQSRVPGGRLTFHTVYPRAQAGVTYAVSAGQLYFRVGLWDREYFAQVNVEYGGSEPVVSATTLGDAGWLLAAREAATNEISVVIFGKDLPELSVYTIRLRQQMHVTHLFCSFLNACQGFLFVFGDQPGQPGQHFVLLKTTDGGRSWNPVRESGTPTAAPGEPPTLARFATEQVGMVCYGYSEAEGSVPELSARTYLTDDGGRTWQSFPALSYGFAVGTEEGEYHTDGYDLTYVDGKYLLRVIARNGTGGYIETPYLSSDLQTWEPYNPFPGLDGWGEDSEHGLGTLPSVGELGRALDRPNSYESVRDDRGGWVAWQYVSSIKIKEKKYLQCEVTLPLYFERNELDYRRNTLDTLFHRNLLLFKPEIKLRIGSFDFTYTYTPTAPSMTYLVNYRDDSDPLNIVQGARELANEHAHDLNLSYRRTLKKQRMYNVGTNFNIRKNSLALGYTYDRTTGVRTITPQTVDGNWHLRFWGGYSTPLDSARRWNLQAGGRAAYYNSADLIDGQRSEVGSYYLTPTLKIDYRPSSRLYLALKADAYYQHSVSSREDFETIDLCDFDYGLTAQVELPFDFQLATDLTMYSRRGYADEGMDSDELVWNARLSKRFFKGNLVLMLDGFDLLGNLSNIRRSINAQGRVETWHNVTPRYAMFHAVYRINKQPKSK